MTIHSMTFHTGLPDGPLYGENQSTPPPGLAGGVPFSLLRSQYWERSLRCICFIGETLVLRAECHFSSVHGLLLNIIQVSREGGRGVGCRVQRRGPRAPFVRRAVRLAAKRNEWLTKQAACPLRSPLRYPLGRPFARLCKIVVARSRSLARALHQVLQRCEGRVPVVCMQQ